MRNILSCYFVKYDDFEFIKFPIHTRTGLLVYNVSRLENVAKMQHQAFTNIAKTLN